MAMSGLGSPDELWASPFHYFVSLRNDFISLMNPPKDEDVERREVAPGTTLEVIKRRQK